LLSAASSGSASDATKTNPSFTVNKVSVQPYDAMMNPMAPFTLANGATSAAQSLGGISQWSFAVNITIGSSSGGGRANNHDALLTFDGAYSSHGAAEDVVLVHNGNSNHPSAAGFTAHAGDFTPAGREGDLTWGGNFPTGVISTACGTQADRNIEQVIVANNPELGLPHLPTATATFLVESNSMEVLDLNTGRYITGPSDNFTFNLLLNP